MSAISTIHHILFSGHMIDEPDRPKPRFPAAKEAQASRSIIEILLEIMQYSHENCRSLQAIAGGACGSDILFHEACLQLHIPSVVYLTLPPQAFKKTSVSFAGPQWDNRFDRLIRELPTCVLDDGNRSPDDETIWADTNAWMLDAALTDGGKQVDLIALWDGQKGDGQGGTEHMVDIVRATQGKVHLIDSLKL